MSRRSPFANPASYRPSVYETYEPAPIWTPPQPRRGWVPGRALLQGGWLLLGAAAARSDQHGTDLLVALAGWALVGVPVLMACRPFRRRELFPVWKRPALAVTFSVVSVLTGSLIVAGALYLLAQHWREALWEAPGLIVAAFAGLAIATGGVVRWRRLTSYHWPYSRDAMLVPPGRWSRRRWLGLVVAVLALVAPPVLVLNGVQGPQVDAASAAAAPPVRPVPERISAVAWRTALPDGERVARVLAGSAGPIAVVDSTTGSGVRAYRGDTGQELWHYVRRARDRPARVGVTPGGGRVVIATDTVHGGAQNTRTTNYTVLDSARGTVTTRFSHSTDEGATPYPTSSLLLTGDDVVLEDHGDKLPLVALSLRDGSLRWSESPQRGCNLNRDAVAGDHLIEQVSCPGAQAAATAREAARTGGVAGASSPAGVSSTAGASSTAGRTNTAQAGAPVAAPKLTVRGVALATGEVSWTHVFGPMPADAPAADLRVSADGSIVTVNSALFDWVLRPGDGDLLFSAQYKRDVPGSPLPVSGGWVMRTGLTGGHLQVLSADKRLLYDSDVAQDKTGWLLLRDQLVHFTYPDDAQSLRGDVDAAELADHGLRPSALTVSPLLTRKTRAAASTGTRIVLSSQLLTRIGGFGDGDDPPVAVPGAVVVHLIQGRSGAADDRRSILVGLR